MMWLYLLVFGSLIAGVILALLWWLIWGRKRGLPVGSVSRFTLAAGLLFPLGEIVMRLMDTSILVPFRLPPSLIEWYGDYRFTIPLLLGILGIVILAFPVQARDRQGSAELTRRSLVSFSRGRWFVVPGVILAFDLLITVVAGAASQPEPTTGRYTTYFVDLGGERGMGTSIYGWFYSVPAMILMCILIVLTIVGLSFIARPALAEDREQDIRARTIRSRNIITAATGALLLHLGLIFGSLSATSSVRAMFSTSEGPVSFWTTFSALGPVLSGASMVCATLGVAFWTTVALSAIPSRRSVPISSES